MSSTQHTNPIDEFLEQAKPAECEVALCLDRDIRDRHQAADLELSRLLTRSAFGVTDAEKQAAADQLAAEQHAQAEAVAAIEAEMAEQQTVFLLRDISWTERAVLMGTNPPRSVEHFQRQGMSEDDAKAANLSDRRQGYNPSAVFPTLVGKCIVSITLPGKEPSEVSPEQWERFAAVLEPEQMERLAAAAIRLVWRPADPKSGLASQTLSNHSGARSKPRDRSGSPTAAS